MQNELIKYLRILRRHVVHYECHDINGKRIISPTYHKVKCCVSFIIAFAIANMLFRSGFPSDFVNVYANILAILIGLFSATMLFGFDSLRETKKEIEGLFEITINNENKDTILRINAEDISYKDGITKIAEKQDANFNLRFVYTTGYNIVLCTITLFLILFGVLINANNYNPFETSFTSTITIETVINFLIGSFSVIQRAIIIYLMYQTLKYTLYVTSSLIQMITVKMKRK